MKRKAANSNGNDRLEEAMTVLIQNQAAFVQNQTAFLARISEMDRLNAERFARIESNIEAILHVLAEHGRLLQEHSRLLQDHSRLLEALPDAIREKMGFKVQSST